MTGVQTCALPIWFTRIMRFPIDFEDAEKPDIYKLTNRKVNLNNNEYFGRGGTMVLTMSYDAFNADEDKLFCCNVLW